MKENIESSSGAEPGMPGPFEGVATGFFSRVRKISLWHIILGAFLIILLTFLTIRASDEYRWSDWGFGDAQSLLSLRQWKEEGWINNYFLFIPQGYAKVERLFDNPELRHHAHGTCPGSSPGVGPRLWYTHYPAGYLIPYALFFEAGIDSMSSMRYLSIVFSLAALALMYVVLTKIITPGAAFIAVFFYGLSATFLGYADSLANQPLDDLMRFAFMLAVVFSTRAAELKSRQRWMVAAWVIEFCLSLSSFDSVFFVYIWLIGWDLLEHKGFRWKRYLVFSLAPVSAHSLQLLQNVWYLGWETALLDIKVTFFQKTGAVQGYADYSGGRLLLTWLALTKVIESQFEPSVLILIMSLFYGAYRFFLRDRAEATLPSIPLLIVLFICGLGYIVVLPHGAQMPYQGRQMAPFVSVLVGGVAWSAVTVLGKGLLTDSRSGSGPRAVGMPLYVLCTLILLILFWYNFAVSDRSPVYPLPQSLPDIPPASPERQGILMAGNQLRQDADFAKVIGTVSTSYDPVYFDIGGFNSMWDPTYVPGYPQINPIVEYYTGSRPVLCFNFPEAAADDILTIIRSSSNRFSPVLLAQDFVVISQVFSALQARGGLREAPATIQTVMGRYFVDLTPYIVWEK